MDILAVSGGKADVGCLRSFGSVDDVEHDILTFGKSSKTLHLNCGEVDKDILAICGLYEAVAFGVIKPLHSTCGHARLGLLAACCGLYCCLLPSITLSIRCVNALSSYR